MKKQKIIKARAIIDKNGLCSISIGINYDKSGVRNYAIYEQSATFHKDILKHFKAKVVPCEIKLLK